MTKDPRRQWQELSTPQRATVVGVGAVQLALAVAAWADLAKRPAEKVSGKKGVWALVIAVNWVGPIAYFAKGRKSS